MRFLFLAMLTAGSGAVVKVASSSTTAHLGFGNLPGGRHVAPVPSTEQNGQSRLLTRSPMQRQRPSSSQKSQQQSNTQRKTVPNPRSDPEQIPGLSVNKSERGRVFHTDSQKGWRGRKKDNPLRNRSRSRSPVVRTSPVEASASMVGPAAIAILRGQSQAEREFHQIEAGEIFKKNWSDPHKLKVDARMHGVGEMQVATYGRKVYAGVRGPPNTSAGAETVGSFGRSARAEFKTREKRLLDDDGLVISSARDKSKSSSRELVTVGSVRTAADRPNGTVGARAWASGPEKYDITTVASNSPLHSPLKERVKAPSLHHPLASMKDRE